MALYSDVDPLYTVAFISERSQLFPSASSLPCSHMRGVSLLAQVLVIAGSGCFSPGSILQGCQPLPDSTL